MNDIKELKILSVDAWNSPEGWTWNSWRDTNITAPVEFLKWSSRRRLKFLRTIGILGNTSQGYISLEDDQYNIVVLDKRTKEPLYAVEYDPFYNSEQY